MTPWWQSLIGFLGLFLLAWLFSENRRAVRCGPAMAALALHFVEALSLLEVPLFRHFFLLTAGLSRPCRRHSSAS